MPRHPGSEVTDHSNVTDLWKSTELLSLLPYDLFQKLHDVDGSADKPNENVEETAAWWSAEAFLGMVKCSIQSVRKMKLFP